MKARQMRAQFEAQNNQTVKHHTARRGVLTVLAAAAAVLVCGTVTVGAVNNWDYSAVFNKYFSDRSGKEVAYDFTGMGLDIGQSFAGEGYTLTVQSVIADAAAVYTLYDIAVNDEIMAQLADSPSFQVRNGISADICTPDEEESYVQSLHYDFLTRIGGNLFRGIYVAEYENGIDLSDMQLNISSTAVFILTDEDDLTILPPISEEPVAVADLSEIKVVPGLETECSVILPLDRDRVEYTFLSLTPMKLTLKRWDYPEDSSERRTLYSTASVDDGKLISVIYADGTEALLTGIGKREQWITRNDDGSCEAMIKETLIFTAPINLDAVKAVRIGETEIPVK